VSNSKGDLPILPGATLGVLGGGQLGRMFVHAAQRMGYFTAVLDPDADSPAGRVSHHHIHTDYGDVDGLARLAGLADAVTTEFENVPAPSLEHLAVARPVAPAAPAIAIAQDRIAEKAHFGRCGVACVPYAAIETAAQLAAVEDRLLPGILKTARLGYDGKGQQRVRTRAELVEAWQATGCVPCVLEKLLPLDFECSVIVARGRDGQLVHFPPQRNLHRDGILAVTEVHGQNMPKTVAQAAITAAKNIANGLGYVGVLCVEFFVLADGSLVVNEMAPRPHNSPLHHGGLRRVAVRAAGAHPGRPAAGHAAPAQPGRDAEPAGRPVVLGRRRQAGLAALERGARAARRPPAPVRQDRTAPRPQDGPPDLHRRRRRPGARHRLAGRAAARPAAGGMKAA